MGRPRNGDLKLGRPWSGDLKLGRLRSSDLQLGRAQSADLRPEERAMKGFGGGGMAQLMKQANQMQMKMKKMQEELATRTYDGTAGGGAVKITVTGDNQVKAVTISPDVMSAGDVEMLQDLIQAATNDALKVAKETSNKEMEKITGGMAIPGLT